MKYGYLILSPALGGVAGVFAQISNTVFMNDTRLLYSGTAADPGVPWGDPGLNPGTYTNETCNTGVKATRNEDASVTLLFTGTDVTILFVGDQLGGTAQVLLDGSQIQEVNTAAATGVSYYMCNFIPVTSSSLPNEQHNVTVVKDTGALYLYMHQFQFTSSLSPPIATSSSARGAATSASSSPPSGSTQGQNQASASHKSPTAAIGGVIGGIIVLALLAVIAWWLLRRRRRSRRQPADLIGPPEPADDANPRPWTMVDINAGTPPSARGSAPSEANLLSPPSMSQVPSTGSDFSSPEASFVSLPPPPSLQSPVTISSGKRPPLGPQSNSYGSTLSHTPSPPAPLPPQLELIQSLVDRNVDNGTIANVIQMMSSNQRTDAPVDQGPEMPEGLEAPPAYRARSQRQQRTAKGRTMEGDQPTQPQPSNPNA